MSSRLDGRTLDDAIAEAEEIIERAIETHPPRFIVSMFSGGNDSKVLLHIARKYMTGPQDGALHINTTIGIEQTREFARNLCHDWWVRLYEWFPDMTYREFIHQFQGFPGPGFHFYPYVNLKERALESFLRTNKNHGEEVLLLFGARAEESKRRMGNAVHEILKDGGQIQVNPILHFNRAEMDEYQSRFDLPRNEVSDHLHISGECLCGAFARPGEKEMVRFFYPETAAEIDALEAEAEAAGLRFCKWGVKRPGPKSRGGIMCHGCDGQLDLLDGAA